MYRSFIIILFIGIAGIGIAQPLSLREIQTFNNRNVKSLDSNGWKNSGTFILNLNQGALSNWAAGGEQNVFGVNGMFNYVFNLKNGKITWDNMIDLALGFQNATSFGKFRKIDDRIDLTSKYAYQVSKKGHLGILANFNSQSIAGYDYSTVPNVKISDFLTPGKILLSPGFNYKPDNKVSIYISPLTIRWVLKSNDDFFNVSKFGVDSAKKVNNELGAYITVKAKWPLAKWATFSSRIDLFSNYKRNPENVDLLMTNLLTMRFNKFLATNLTFDLIYDDDIIKRLQIKEILGIGLTLKL